MNINLNQLNENGIDNQPEGIILIENREIYDGWSVAKLPDGTLINRWHENDRRYIPTEEFIEMMKSNQT